MALEKYKEACDLVYQLEYLLLSDGYHKSELARVVSATVSQINDFLLSPENADVNQPWCREVSFLYEMNRKFG